MKETTAALALDHIKKLTNAAYIKSPYNPSHCSVCGCYRGEAHMQDCLVDAAEKFHSLMGGGIVPPIQITIVPETDW